MHRSASEGFNSQYNLACDSNKALCKTLTEPNIPLADCKKLHAFSIPTFNLQCPNIREIMESFLSFGDADNFDRWKWNVDTGTPLLTMKNVEDGSKTTFLNRKRFSLADSLQKGDIIMADFKCIENQKENSNSIVIDSDAVVNKENDSDHTEVLALNEQRESPESGMEQQKSFLNENDTSVSNNVIFERMYEIMESTKISSVGITSDIQENTGNRKSMSEENIFRTDVTAKELTKSTTSKCDNNFSTSDSDLLSCDYDWSNEENDGSIDIDLYNRECLNSYNLSTLESDIEDQLHYDLTNTLASIVDPNPTINAEKDYELFPLPNSSKSFENIQTQIYFQPDYQEPIDSNLCFHEEPEISLDPYVLWVNSLYFNSDEHFITAGNAEETEDDISTETMIYFSKLQDLRNDKTQTVTNEMDSVLYRHNSDVCKTKSQYNKNETFCIKDSLSSGDDNSQSKWSFRSPSTNDGSIYDERCFGRSDVFHPLLTNSEQKMVGVESAYSNNSIFKNSIEESFGPNGAAKTISDATIDRHNISRNDNDDSGQLFDCDEETSEVHNDLTEPHYYYTSTSQSVKEQLNCIADLAKTCTININDFLQGTSNDRAKREHSISSDVYQYQTENSEKDDKLEKLLEAHDLKVQEQLCYISGIVQLCNDNITELLESLQRSRSCIPSSKIDMIKDEDGKSLENPNSDLDACDKYIQTESGESIRNNIQLYTNLSKNNTSNGKNDINRIWEHVKMFRTNNRSLKQQKNLSMTNIKRKYKCKDNISTVKHQLGEENEVVFESKEDMKLQTMKYLHLADMEYKKNKETLVTDKNRGKLRNFLFVNMTKIDSLKIQHKRKIQRLTIEFNQKKVKADKELKKKFQDLKCKMYVEACKMETKLKKQRQSLDIWLTNKDLCLSKAVLNMSLTDEFEAVNDIN